MENNSTKKRVKKSNVYRPERAARKKVNHKINFDKRLLWNSLNAFISGLLGGIAFAIGAIAFLSVKNKNVGSAIFSLGMIVIFAYGFGFYTSKIGYAIKNTKEQNIMLFPIWLGNLLGAMLVGGVMHLTRAKISSLLQSRANQLCSEKLSDSVGGVLVLSIFCGLLMFIATDNYKNAKNAAQKYITLILTSMIFLLSGFEHFASSGCMFAMAGNIDIRVMWYLLIMTLGNTIGALIIPLSHSGVKLVQNLAKK